MKIFLIVFFALFITNNVHSQNFTKDSLIKKMSAEICKEIKANDSMLLKTVNFEMQLGLLMVPIMSQYKIEIAEVVPGFSFENSEALEKLTEELGTVMAMNCPIFLTIIAARPELINNTNLNPERSLEGKLMQIQEGDFTSIQVKLSNGRTEKLWWMEFFEGADTLGSKELVSKKVSVRYIEKEVYNAAIKDYIIIKVITGISKQ